MKIAILILCHKNPKQINLLLDKLNHQDIDCYIHIDKKADFANKITKRSNIVLLPDEKRVSVEWAQISMVTATINLVEEAHRHGKYDYYWLISGQDWPLRSADKIVKFLKNTMARILFSIGIVKTMEVINKTIWINGIKSIFQLNLLAENRGKRSSRGGGLNSPEDTIRRGKFSRENS